MGLDNILEGAESPAQAPNGSCTTDPCFFGAMNRFVVFRGNRVRSNGGVVVSVGLLG